ncbi:Hippurate hydrolase [Roseobacter fucihabitans]|uniref:Hippurate hydrolase n=1 Tax=Roseobacter fucihabitans TaxID=1537242 RepID=A0ABZ2BXI8_9RHOB|nr:amidohydrolase [Roseobacter litoralis]MBC6967229.1 putative hydrolase YxeP [Roseobacter litoralis]
MSELTNSQCAALTELRHQLHAHPELSGEEIRTAGRIALALEEAGADHLYEGLGGHGVAASFAGPEDGPTVLIRCELDGLPIEEISDLPYRSAAPGKGHLCGHDGHMAIVMGVAKLLARRPKRGRVILLFQPAEETGQGAATVIADPRWPALRPDFAFAFHNVPGRRLGEIGLRTGPACCASRGVKVQLVGKSSHAAEPQNGLSPAAAMARLMGDLETLGMGGVRDGDFRLSTLTHARLGAPTFGIAPGEGELRVTLRSSTDDGIAQMVKGADAAIADARGALTVETSFCDIFQATLNHLDAIALARAAAEICGNLIQEMDTPQSWSEDFGQFGLDGAKSAIVFLGAGENHPQLHNPDYDFPDDLIAPGAKLMRAIIALLLD